MEIINDRVKLTINDHVAQVLLARPDKMNALDPTMFEALIEAGSRIRDDRTVRVVVISGEGRAFCAGLDMQNFAGMLDPEATSETVSSRLEERTHGIANKPQFAAWLWRELPVPVIAAVHGAAVGGGLQLALAADMRYAAPDTQMSIMEIKWGLVPDMSSTQLMRHLASEDIVRELSYTGRIFDANEAKEYGLVTRVCDDPLEQAMSVAHEIACKNPDAIRANKRMFNAANYISAEKGLLMESKEQDRIIESANHLEAVMAELQKRPADFKD